MLTVAISRLCQSTLSRSKMSPNRWLFKLVDGRREVEQCAGDGYDIGVRYGDQVAKDMIAVRVAADTRMAIVCAPSYLEQRARPREPQDLLAHNCITLRLPTRGGLYAWELKKGRRAPQVRVAALQKVCGNHAIHDDRTSPGRSGSDRDGISKVAAPPEGPGTVTGQFSVDAFLVMLADSSTRDRAMTTHASLQTFARAFRPLWLAWAACLLAATPNAWAQVRNIDVAHDGDTYVVTVQVFAPVSRQIAWDVLTDFPHMAGWVPNLKESTVVKPGDKQLTIEQSGTAKFGGVGFSYTSVREIVLDPQTTIKSTQVKGSMRRQESLMTLSTEGDGTRMQYRLELVPNLLASAALSADRLKQEIQEQFTAIVGEMTKRKK